MSEMFLLSYSISRTSALNLFPLQLSQRKKISDDIHDDLSGSLAALKFYISDCTLHADSEQARRLLTSIEAEVGTVYENARAYLHNLRTEASGRQYDPPGDARI